MATSEWIQHEDLTGRTVFHWFSLNSIDLSQITSLLPMITNDELIAALTICDWSGKSVITYAIEEAVYPPFKQISHIIPHEQLIQILRAPDRILRRNAFHHMICHASKHEDLLLPIFELLAAGRTQAFARILHSEDIFGKTIIHYIAEHNLLRPFRLILKGIASHKNAASEVGQLLLKRDKYHKKTPLHYSVISGSSALVEDICLLVATTHRRGSPQFQELFELLIWTQKDVMHKSAIHYALERSDKDVLSMMLNNTPNSSRNYSDFIYRGYNLLNVAIVCNVSSDTIVYLLSKLKTEYCLEILNWQDLYGKSALHFAASTDYSTFQRVLQLFPEEHRLHISTYNVQDCEGKCVLHIAPMHPGILDLILSSLETSDKVAAMELRDTHGNTPFHNAVATEDPQVVQRIFSWLSRREIAKLLTNYFSEYTLCSNKPLCNFGFLLPILWDKTIGIWEMLTQNQKRSLLPLHDENLQTMLHFVLKSSQYTQYLCEIIAAVKECELSEIDYLTTTDSQGLTPLALGLLHNQVDEVDDLLHQVRESTATDVIHRRNQFGNNLFFYASLCKEATYAWEILCDHFHGPLFRAMSVDLDGNNPLLYALCATEDPLLILMMIVKRFESFTAIKQLLQKENRYGVNCVTVRPHMDKLAPFGAPMEGRKGEKLAISKSVTLVKFHDDTLWLAVNRGRHHRKEIAQTRNININVRELVFYLLSSYSSSPLDNGCVMFLPMETSLDHLQWQGDRTTHEALCCVRDGEEKTIALEVDVIVEPDRDSGIRNMQGVYHRLNSQAVAGNPKVVVIHTESRETLKLADPARPQFDQNFDPKYPDILVLIVHHNSLSMSDDSFLKCHQLVQSQDLYTLVSRMTWQCHNHRELCGLTVISTLNRDIHESNTQRPSGSYAVIPPPLPAYSMHSRIPSKALIICNTWGRKKWESELRYAYAALCHLFSVTVCFDLRAKEIETQVRNFSNMPHGACVAVAILSHGVTDGRIRGNSGKRRDMCSVTQITDALNVDSLRHTPKVLVMEYCRGNTKTSGKMEGSFETEFVRKHLILTTGGAFGGPNIDLFKPYAIPDEDFFIIYSTLHDSRSHCGHFWRETLKYLVEVTNHRQDVTLMDIETLFARVSHRVKTYSSYIQFAQYTSTLRHRLIFHLMRNSRLKTLMTDL